MPMKSMEEISKIFELGIEVDREYFDQLLEDCYSAPESLNMQTLLFLFNDDSNLPELQFELLKLVEYLTIKDEKYLKDFFKYIHVLSDKAVDWADTFLCRILNSDVDTSKMIDVLIDFDHKETISCILKILQKIENDDKGTNTVMSDIRKKGAILRHENLQRIFSSLAINPLFGKGLD